MGAFGVHVLDLGVLNACLACLSMSLSLCVCVCAGAVFACTIGTFVFVVKMENEKNTRVFGGCW